MTEPSELLQLLADEREIRRVVLRYCRGIDRLDTELVRSCYHADATDEHGSFTGGIDAYVTWVFELLDRYDSTFHLVANQLIDVATGGDVARSETYGFAHHRGSAAGHDGGFDPTRNLTTGFRFVDRFERRRDGEWRIATRVATTEWSRVDDEAGRWPVPNHLRHGTRDASDPVWNLVPEVRTRALPTPGRPADP